MLDRLRNLLYAMGVPNKGRRLLWIDGVNSAVMGKMELARDPEAQPMHCDLGDSVHPDSHRFIDDLEQWYGKPIIRIRSEEYANIDEVFESIKYLAGTKGARCTGAMKFVPRLNYQVPSDIHYWGYTADSLDAARFANMCKNYPELRQSAPLIVNGLRKADTHRIIEEAGIRKPYVYLIGYPNGNCLGCVKASSPNYWSMTRKYFPNVFERRADQSRRFGARLTRIRGERVFIDEIPADWPTTMRGQSVPTCGFVCEQEAAP